MNMGSSNRRVWLRLVRAGIYILSILIILGGAGLLSYWIKESEPVAEREAATRKTAALVHTIVVEHGTYRPTITSLGSVVAARDILLSSRVSGQVIEVENVFTLGGIIEEGELLLRIDPSDYEQALVARESELLQVEAELAIEEGQQRVARREFELLGTEIEDSNRSLVLREPQIESLRAKLKAARAAVDRAKLDLDRTEIRAPFDGQILARSAELGSQVSQGDELARIVGSDVYWIIATVPLSTLQWIEFPDADGRAGASATVRHRTAWPAGKTRQGSVGRLIGEVDESTRMARVIVEVQQPMGDGTPETPALILGSIVQVEITARPIDQVVQLERALLRQNDTVWLMDSNQLRIQSVEVLFSDAEYAYISSGLTDGDRVVTTNLATVVDGLEIRELTPSVQTSATVNSAPDEGAP